MTYPCTTCIMDMLRSSGPQDRQYLRRECRAQVTMENGIIRKVS